MEEECLLQPQNTSRQTHDELDRKNGAKIAKKAREATPGDAEAWYGEYGRVTRRLAYVSTQIERLKAGNERSNLKAEQLTLREKSSKYEELLQAYEKHHSTSTECILNTSPAEMEKPSTKPGISVIDEDDSSTDDSTTEDESERPAEDEKNSSNNISLRHRQVSNDETPANRSTINENCTMHKPRKPIMSQATDENHKTDLHTTAPVTSEHYRTDHAPIDTPVSEQARHGSVQLQMKIENFLMPRIIGTRGNVVKKIN